MDYLDIIKCMFGLETIFDATGIPLVTLAYDSQGQLVVETWNIPFPQATIAEIEAYAASPEYAAILAQREIDRQADEAETTLVEGVLADIATELSWLDTAIAGYDAMTTAQKLAAFKRVMQEMQGVLRILRWFAKNWG